MMSTKVLIAGVIIVLAILIVYQIVVYLNFRKKVKQGPDSNQALELFFRMSPFRSVIYQLFMKDKIRKTKRPYKMLKRDD